MCVCVIIHLSFMRFLILCINANVRASDVSNNAAKPAYISCFSHCGLTSLGRHLLELGASPAGKDHNYFAVK